MRNDHFIVLLVAPFDKVDNGTNLLEEFSDLRNHLGVGDGVGIKVANKLQLVYSLKVVKDLGFFDVSWDFGWVLGDKVI